MELSDIIFWISVFIALYGGKSLFDFRKRVLSNRTQDYINNLDKKKNFLNKEFDYLINSVVECEGIPPAFYETKKKKWRYEITHIIINPPKKTKKNVWEILVSLHKIGFHLGYGHHRNANILNISDQELERVITDGKNLDEIINPIKIIKSMKNAGVTILNPDVFKKIVTE